MNYEELKNQLDKKAMKTLDEIVELVADSSTDEAQRLVWLVAGRMNDLVKEYQIIIDYDEAH